MYIKATKVRKKEMYKKEETNVQKTPEVPGSYEGSFRPEGEARRKLKQVFQECYFLSCDCKLKLVFQEC